MDNFWLFIKNRYFLTALVFLLWMSFLDKDDLFSQINLDKKLFELESEKRYYNEEIAKLKSELYGLQNNPQKIEKLAREKYYMKKKNEDVFLLWVEPKSNNKISLNKTHSTFADPIPQ